MTPGQEKRRAELLRAHYEDNEARQDYRSPREWQRQVFWLDVKRTMFHLVLKIAILAAAVGGLWWLYRK